MLIEFDPAGHVLHGQRVFWGNGLDRIVKLDYATHEVITEYAFPGEQRWSAENADQSIAEFDDSNDGIFAAYHAYQEGQKLRNLSKLYTVLDKDHVYYIGRKLGLITAYGDEDPGDSTSNIVKLREFQLPPEATGPIMGLNMTYDGWRIAATEHHLIRIKNSEGAEEKGTRGTGYGWIRNAYAIDDDGGIYIASQQHMHKIVWNGKTLSTDEADGAWSEEYLNEWGHGTGATPSLMGFGDEDQFVVITDGQMPVTMGDSSLTKIQSEQSVVVAGYGAMVVNNHPRNIPWYLPARAASLLVSYLGSNSNHQPYGVQKFEWDPVKRQLTEDWVNKQVSSPSTVPIVGVGSNPAYLIGARNNQWTLEAMDWDTH